MCFGARIIGDGHFIAHTALAHIFAGLNSNDWTKMFESFIGSVHGDIHCINSHLWLAIINKI